MPDPSVWQYVSRGDHAIVVSMPDHEASKKIGSDLYYPVKFGKHTHLFKKIKSFKAHLF